MNLSIQQVLKDPAVHHGMCLNRRSTCGNTAASVRWEVGFHGDVRRCDVAVCRFVQAKSSIPPGLIVS